MYIESRNLNLKEDHEQALFSAKPVMRVYVISEKKKKKGLCAELWEGGYFSVRLTPSVMYGALT